MNAIHKLLKSFCVLLGIAFATVALTSTVNVNAAISYDQIAQIAVDEYVIPGSEDVLGLSEDVWLQRYEYVTKKDQAFFTWTTVSPNLTITEIPETDPNYSKTNASRNLLLVVTPDNEKAVTAELKLEATYTRDDKVYTAERTFELKIAQFVELMDYATYENVTDGNLIKINGYIYAKGDKTTDLAYNAVIIKDVDNEEFYYLNNVDADPSYVVGNLVQVLGFKTKTGKIGDFGKTVNAEANAVITEANNKLDIDERAPLINTVPFEASVITVKKMVHLDDTVTDITVLTKTLDDIKDETLYTVAYYNNIKLVSEDSKLYFVSGNTKIEVVNRQYVNEDFSRIIEVMNPDELFNMKLITVFEDGVKKVEPFGQGSVEYVDSDLQVCYDSIINVLPIFADGRYSSTISNISLPSSDFTEFSWSADNKYVNFRTDGTGTTNAIIKIPSSEDLTTTVTLTSSLNGKSVSRTFKVYVLVGTKEPIKAADKAFAIIIGVAIAAVLVASYVAKKRGEEAAIIRRQELAAREEKARAARSEEADKQLANLSGNTRK